MSESGWTDELVAEREQDIVERGKRFLSEQERVRAAKGFVGALSEMARPCGDTTNLRPTWHDRDVTERAGREKSARKPRIRGVAPKEDRCYDGIVYHSLAEAQYAAKLDLLLNGKAIQRWERQIRIPLMVNDIKVCTMIVDFLIVNNDGTKEYHEVKGMESEAWKLKYKLLKACRPDINYVVVKV